MDKEYKGNSKDISFHTQNEPISYSNVLRAVTRSPAGTKQLSIEVIYQTRATVFHRDIQTPRRELKIRRAAEYF